MLYRIIAAVIAFCWRIAKKPRPFKPTIEVDQVPVQLLRTTVDGKTKRQPRVTSSSVRIEFETEALFNLTRESKWQCFLKSVGISSEYQIGDRRFDERLFLACDHPAFEACLTRSAEARELLLAIFNTDIQQVSSDGSTLTLTTNRDITIEESQAFARLAIRLKQALSVLEAGKTSLLKDRFTWRIILIEAIFAAITTFAFVGFIESAFGVSGAHLKPWSLFFTGLLYALPPYALLLALTIAFIRGSSHASKVIWEMSIGLALVLPIATCRMVLEINRGWDQRPATAYEFEIEGRSWKHGATSRGSHSRNNIDYFVHLAHPAVVAPTKGPVHPSEIPARLDIPPDLYKFAEQGNKFTLELKPGWLNHPWISAKRISFKPSRQRN